MSRKKNYTESAYAHPFFAGMRIRKRKELKLILAIVLLCTSVNAEIDNETESCEVIRKEETKAKMPKIDCNFMDVLQKSIGSKFENSNSELDIALLLKGCREHTKANRLTTGEEGTALECFQQVLNADPYNADALEGLQHIESQYIIWTDRALRRNKLKKAREYMAGLARVNPESPSLFRLEERIKASDQK